MPEYRLYYVGNDGRFAGVEDIDAADDAAAIEASQQYIGDRAVELWLGGRKVKMFAVAAAKKSRPSEELQ